MVLYSNMAVSGKEAGFIRVSLKCITAFLKICYRERRDIHDTYRIF